MKRPELATPKDFAKYLERAPRNNQYLPDVYAHIGRFCYDTYTHGKSKLRTGGVEHGFSVAARLVRNAAKLYPIHVAETGAEGDPETLRVILLKSTQTPLRFANMPNTMNSIVERHFGLKADSVPPNLTELFKFEHNTAEGTIFIADDEQFWIASTDAEGEMSVQEYRRNGQCPMTHITAEVVWPTMVNMATETPEAFAAELELAVATS